LRGFEALSVGALQFRFKIPRSEKLYSLSVSEAKMRPEKTTGSNDLFRARLDPIISMKQELVRLAGKIDWDWIDGEIAPLYSENARPGIEARFMIGRCCSSTFAGWSDEGCTSAGSTTRISSTSLQS
jgi:hypothetical protein